MTEAPRRLSPPPTGTGRRPRRSVRYVTALDGIRAFAALGIVLIHTESEADSSLFVYGMTGLLTGPFFMSFFIITGFVAYRGWARKHLAAHDPKDEASRGTADGGSDGRRGSFLLRRLIRIYPLYWVVATFAMILSPSSADHTYSIIDRLQVYLLLPLPRVENLVELGLGLIIWTLVMDVFFYVFVSLWGAVMDRLIKALPKADPFRVEMWVLVPMLIIPFALAPFVSGLTAAVGCLPIGMLFATFEAKHDRTGRLLAVPGALAEFWWLWLILTFTIGPYYVWSIRDLDDHMAPLLDIWPIPALLVLTSVWLLSSVLWGSRRWLPNRFFNSEQMRKMSRYTYGLYLWHPVIHIILREHMPDVALWENLLITTTGSLALAFVTYHLLEEPLGRVRARLREPAAVTS